MVLFKILLGNFSWPRDIKGDQSLSVLFQFWSLPKAAPWTEARVSRHLPHSQGTFLLVVLPCLATSTGRHTQKLHFPSSLIYCKLRRRVSTWNGGFLWPSLLDLGTLWTACHLLQEVKVGIVICLPIHELHRFQSLQIFQWMNLSWCTKHTCLWSWSLYGLAMPARAIKSVSKPQQRHLKILVLIWSEGREGEEGHRGNTENYWKSSFKGGKATNLPFYQFTKRVSLKVTGNRRG